MKNYHCQNALQSFLVFTCAMVIWKEAWARFIVVFGIDDTGSCEIRRQAVEIAKSVIQQLQPEGAGFGTAR